MKRILLIAAPIAAVLAGVGAFVLLSIRARSPQVLLDRLARGGGDRQELIMRLNVVRGDVVSPMIDALQDTRAPAEFRADVLELLFKRNFRSAEERIEQAILAALKDPNVIVRRKAVYGLAAYAEESLQVAMIDNLTDPDRKVRSQVYLTFGADASYQKPEGNLWPLLSRRQKEKMIEVCLDRMKAEETPELRLMARAIIGREIEIRGQEAVQALQASDVTKAEKILRGALKLDPANHQAQVRLVRFYMKSDRKDEALAMAREYGAVFEIPLLSKAPVIDGDPAEEVWSEGLASETFYSDARWVPQLTKGKSKAILGHRDGTLYITVLGYEKELDKLAQKHKTRDSAVWADDCVELVFDPGNTGKDIYQFAINPAGAMFDHFNGDKGKNFECRYKAAVFKDRGYWALEFALAGKDLGNHPIKSGTIWSFNVYRTRVGPGSEQGGIWPPFRYVQRVDIYPIALFK